MSFQRCPQCQTDTLAPTGAYWCCMDCETAITSQALAAINSIANPKNIRRTLSIRRPLSMHKVSSV